MSPRRLAFLALSMVLAGLAPAWEANGQIGGGGGGGVGGGGVGGGGGNQVNASGPQIAGVLVDAEGVLRLRTFRDPGGVLSRQRIVEARAKLNPDVSRSSKLRKVSLNRLELAAKERLDRDGQPTEEMLYLAGLSRIQYVFFYPETGDIVLAGPAEGWAADLSGRVCGIETGRPVIELADLVVALRAFPPQGKDTPLISCSIDPTQEGLARLQGFLRRIGTQATPGQTKLIVDGLRQSLGMQVVSITGVPATTHFAQVLVEADYRMKLIGIGLERPRVKLASYVEMASPAGVARNAMQRWYFVPNYECVRVSDEGLAMELVGDGVKLIGADELVAADGTRHEAAGGDAAGKRFVDGFTVKYPELAAAIPVYAQLRNLIDMAVAAAFIQQQEYYGRAGWLMETFGNESAFPVQTVNPPQHVESAVNAVWKGRRLMTPIGGGVRIEPRNALYPENLLRDEQGVISSQRQKISPQGLAKGQWWWD